ncbi:MAG: sodium:solute symporter, partial [Verrucomicrobiota bacterium]|jgi:SSS family solute:Na+ symporter|nr:sodium:solute symporter [Verrucomicrobiota bacterium]
MSIFATFVSSISFLGLPAKAYAGNWNAFVYSLTIPVASWMAVRFFVPLYRSLNSVSAYQFLEARFGVWARVYASVCYLVSQVARTGTILYLLALPMNALLGWSVPQVILVTGIGVLLYSMMGGIQAVVWTDAVQGILLIAGTLLCLGVLLFSMPEGIGHAWGAAVSAHKFDLGSWSLTDWGSETFWVCFAYGVFVNLQNYGIDQNYIQRYLTARTRRDAIRSTLFGSLLYIPVSFLFFAIGTALFAYYQGRPGGLPPEIAAFPDRVLPYFIVHGLPTGVTGLLIAAIFAAGMSTVSTSLNSGATVLLEDYYRRYINPDAGDASAMRVLRGGTVAVAVLGMGCALALMRVRSALDAYWAMQSVFSGGMLGLFLLGYFSKKAHSPGTAFGVVLGLLTIAWISVFQRRWPLPVALHTNLSIVFGTSVIFVTGFVLGLVTQPAKRK